MAVSREGLGDGSGDVGKADDDRVVTFVMVIMTPATLMLNVVGCGGWE